MTTLRNVILIAAVAMAAAVAGAGQDQAGRADMGDEPIGGAEADFDSEVMYAFLASLSEEELEQLIADAAAARLHEERREVAAELARGLLYDPAEVDEAIERLADEPEDTRQDNIERICRAFADVDFRLAEPFEHFQRSRYAEAAEALGGIINPNDASYLSAAKHHLLAGALAASDKPWEAIEVYGRMLQRMSDRHSFAADAAERTAEVFEDLGRGLYALEAYRLCFSQYGLMLSKERYEEIQRRIRELEGLYGAPLSAAGEMMGDVAERLAAADGGEQTVQKQQEIVRLLEDLIQTAEESSGGGQQGAQGQRQRQQRQGQSRREESGRQQGDAPTSPRETGVVMGGENPPVHDLSRVHEGGDTGDWASLPPREREKLQEAAEEAMPERYRDIIRDYRTRMAEDRP